MTYIHHHLGLGDHFICNGLVRELVKNGPCSLYCKHSNIPTVCAMYRDLPGLDIVAVGGDEDITGHNISHIGFDYILGALDIGLTWDEAFYHQCGIPFEKRWSAFYISRDPEREESLSRKLNPNNLPFALMHSMGSDGIDRVDPRCIDPSLLHITVQKGVTDNLLDYLGLLERASQIHCIDSSLKHLADSVITNGELFYHNGDGQRSAYGHRCKKAWSLI